MCDSRGLIGSVGLVRLVLLLGTTSSGVAVDKGGPSHKEEPCRERGTQQ